MPLTLLTGPAGSGKTGEVLERFTAALEREPILVVPTQADVERFEDELLARRPVALGGRILTFERLFELAAGAAGIAPPPPLGRAQSRALLAAVVDSAELDALAEPARRRGFVDALGRFVAEAQAALVPAERIAAAAGGSRLRRRHLRELAGLYGGYLERRDALGRSDRHSLAAAVAAELRRRPDAWGGRPLLVHGFDDLTPAQLALIEAVATGAEVLVSVLHEPGRACLRARTRLVERVEALGAAAAPLERVELPAGQGTGLLGHLERSLMTDLPKRREPDGGLRLLAAGGVRSEVEQVGAAVAGLLRAGTPPDQIAVLVRSPESSARLVGEVLAGFGVPVAVHGERPLAETAAGAALVALLRTAFASQAAEDLLSFLRSPGRAPLGLVDRLERAVRTEGLESADEALERWTALGGRPLRELDILREAAARGGGALLERAAAVARGLFERPHLRSAPLLDGAERSDLAAADSLAAALDEMAELAASDPALAPSPGALLALIEGAKVPRTTGGVAGRVEVMSPYRARARQFAHVFVLSLQEGEFPRRRAEDPFLTDAERTVAGMPPRADSLEEERYLFYVCLTRATRRLHLSFRVAEDEGTAATRSFLVEEVLDLLAPGAEEEITQSKGLSATVFEPHAAPTERELARSLAERRLSEPPLQLAASDALARRLSPPLRRACRRADHLPGPLRVPFVRERFAEKLRIGASSLERYAECPFRYFVDHELEPRELAPKPEPLERGGAIHAVLERLYEEQGRPRPDTLEAARARARELLVERTAGTSLDPRRPAVRPVWRRMESDIYRWLRYDSRHAADGPVEAVEASFGAGEDDDRPALKLGGFELHGKIDRIDLVGPGRVLIRDYKSGWKVASRKEIAEEKRLQLPLYMLAVREQWSLEPVGGVYHPLGKQHGEAPRGLLRGPERESAFEESFVRTDWTADAAEFERALADAREEGEAIAGRIHAGHLGREPLGGSCPAHCGFHPICRRERGEKNPEENGRSAGDAEEEEGVADE